MKEHHQPNLIGKKQRRYGRVWKEALYLNYQKMLCGGSMVLHSLEYILVKMNVG